MPDPVSNVEIEDVLSSIRRLVSEGEKARQSTAPVAPEEPQARLPASEPRGPVDLTEKLVLTPALRVATRDEAIEPKAPAQAARPSASDRASLEATIAELEAAVVEQDDEWEPDGSEVKTTVQSWDQVGDPDPANLTDAPIDQGVLEADEDAAPAAEEASLDLPRDLDQPMIEFAEAAPDAEEPEDVSQDVAPEPAMSFEDRLTAAAAQMVGDDVLAHVQQAEPETPNTPERVEPATETPDPSVAFRHLSRSEPVSPRDVTGDVATEPQREANVNDATLRAMVMEIVRSELQGPLGERITRNVRKLVRREIMRVLNAQDMD